MQNSFLRRLRSDSTAERIRAWNELQDQPELSQGFLSPEDRRELSEALQTEVEDSVRMEALTALLSVNACPCALPNAAPSRGRHTSQRGLSLDDWFLNLFRNRRSALFGITEKDHHRDADALAQLARRFPSDEFYHTDLQHVVLGDDGLSQLLIDHNYETILVVGRLWMFGQAAMETLQGKSLRLQFPKKYRPPALKHGDIHPEYHRIHEIREDDDTRKAPIVYVTEEHGDRRTDYGVIQVYRPCSGHRRLTVVLCAGCSSLGTLGAAWWLSQELWRPHGADGESPIPVPRNIGADSRMEALIRVQATLPKHTWRPSHIELASLYVDDYLWQPESARWQRAKKHVVEVKLRKQTPVSLLIDGERTTMQANSQTFRLAAQLALAVEDSEQGTVSVESLAQNTVIWGGHQSTCTTRRRLHTLGKRALRGLIRFDGGDVRLNAKVIRSQC